MRRTYARQAQLALPSRIHIWWVVGVLAATLLMPGTVMPATAVASTTHHAAQSRSVKQNLRPCDIYARADTPCAAAHSTVRALYASYKGALYQVRRASDHKTRNITVLTAGGYANAAAQDKFCAKTTCVITVIYDQSPNHNNLVVGGGGGTNATPDKPAVANKLKITAGGHHVYGVWIDPGMGYRDVSTRGVPTGSQSESMYMVASGTHTTPKGPGVASCCFDYGNVQPSVHDEGAGTMDAINFSSECGTFGIGCRGTGPWVQADLENGVFQSTTGASTDPTNTGETSPFVTAMLRNDGKERFALKSGNAVTGPLRTRYDGPLPYVSPLEPIWCLGLLKGTGKTQCDLLTPYRPMDKGGALVMGTGGDNSDNGVGSFFEGVITVGIASNATDQLVQANIQSVRYAQGWR